MPILTPFLNNGLKQAKRLIIAVVGFTVLGLGLVMLILPGPGIVVIIIGLAVLASEFIWARSLLKKVKARFRKNKEGGNVYETK